jgi:hypothetical protein
VKNFRKIILTLLLCTISKNAFAGPALYGLASFIPGLGQTINGSPWEGLGWFATSITLMVANDYRLNMIGQNIWFYNMYDAWADAGGKPADKKWAIVDYAQNFNPTHLLDPFALGFIGLGYSGRKTARPKVLEEDDDFARYIAKTDAWKSIGVFTFVGFGEEALFRGFLFPSMSSWMGVWGGAIGSSAIFGFAHRGNGTSNIIRTLMGMVFCWQLHSNKYNLGGNIFAHSWYDQILVGPMMLPPLDSSKETDLKSAWENKPLGLNISYRF